MHALQPAVQPDGLADWGPIDEDVAVGTVLFTMNPPTADGPHVQYTPYFSIRAGDLEGGRDERSLGGDAAAAAAAAARLQRGPEGGRDERLERGRRRRPPPLSFSVDQRSGMVKVSRELDYESTPTHAFVVDIAAGGLPGETAMPYTESVPVTVSLSPVLCRGGAGQNDAVSMDGAGAEESAVRIALSSLPFDLTARAHTHGGERMNERFVDLIYLPIGTNNYKEPTHPSPPPSQKRGGGWGLWCVLYTPLCPLAHDK